MMNQSKTNIFRLDTDSFEILFDTGTSSRATPDKNYFIEGTHIKLQGVTIHGIAARLQDLGYRTVKWPIYTDKGEIVDLYLERVLHFKQLSQCILSLQKMA